MPRVGQESIVATGVASKIISVTCVVQVAKEWLDLHALPRWRRASGQGGGLRGQELMMAAGVPNISSAVLHACRWWLMAKLGWGRS